MYEGAYKYCPTCKRDLPLGAFGVCRGNKDGISAYCRSCKSAAVKRSRARLTPEERSERSHARYLKRKTEGKIPKRTRGDHRRVSLWKLYRLTPRDFDVLLERQHGRCAACGKEHTADKPLCVDHVHDDTKKVRGLLCNNCNRALGLLGDNPVTLVNLLSYVQQW